MSTPAASPWEHLQSVLDKTYNRKVKEEFKDIADEISENDDSIQTGRASLKAACLMKDSDSAPIVACRMMLFYMTLRGAVDLHPPIYGIPCDAYQMDVVYKPQIKLFFREDLDDVEESYTPVKAEYTFRLFNETSQTLTPSEALNYAHKIKNEFATGRGYIFKKGRIKLSYRRPDQGYSLVLTAYSDSEGKELLEKILSIQNHRIDNDYLTISKRESNPPIVPPSEHIYGQSRRLPRKRPVANVRFQWAELHVWGLPKPVVLVDRSGRKPNPLVEV
jgi:hypothetical protein